MPWSPFKTLSYHQEWKLTKRWRKTNRGMLRELPNYHSALDHPHLSPFLISRGYTSNLLTSLKEIKVHLDSLSQDHLTSINQRTNLSSRSIWINRTSLSTPPRRDADQPELSTEISLSLHYKTLQPPKSMKLWLRWEERHKTQKCNRRQS